MISAFQSWFQPRKLALGLFALFLFACYDLWLHPLLFQGNEMSLCMMKEFWGIPCPACGTAHGIQFLVKGDFSSALYANPLSIAVAAFFPLFIVFAANDFWKGEKRLDRFFIRLDLYFRKNPIVFWLGILLILANWYWNLTKW